MNREHLLKVALLLPKWTFVFVREASDGLKNAYDVVSDTARIDMFGLGAGASTDELRQRREKVKDDVIRRAVQTAGMSDIEFSKEDLVRMANADGGRG